MSILPELRFVHLGSRFGVNNISFCSLHLLGPLVQEVYKRFNKEFLFKRNDRGLFVTKGLPEYILGSAIRNRRKREEEKARFPIDFWEQRE